MLTAEQLALRMTGIGSSEIGAVLNLYPPTPTWPKAHDVYLKKRGLVDDEQKDTLSIKIGNIVEALTVELYEGERKCKTETATTVAHPDHPWALCTVDRLVLGKPRILECKWVGWRLCDHWTDEDDGVPDYVRAQVEWQMLVTGKEEAHVAAILGGEEFRIYEIQRNDRLGALLLEKGREFWFEHVLKGEPPPVDGSENSRNLLETIFHEYKPKMLLATPLTESWIEKLVRAKAEKKAAQEREAEAENQLCKIIGEEDGDGIESPRGKIYWRRAKGDKKRRFGWYPKKQRNAGATEAAAAHSPQTEKETAA